MVGIVKWSRPRVVAPVCVGSNPTTHPIKFNTIFDVGVSPSGKAMDSDSIMRRFESCYPSQQKRFGRACVCFAEFIETGYEKILVTQKKKRYNNKAEKSNIQRSDCIY